MLVSQQFSRPPVNRPAKTADRSWPGRGGASRSLGLALATHPRSSPPPAHMTQGGELFVVFCCFLCYLVFSYIIFDAYIQSPVSSDIAPAASSVPPMADRLVLFVGKSAIDSSVV